MENLHRMYLILHSIGIIKLCNQENIIVLFTSQLEKKIQGDKWIKDVQTFLIIACGFCTTL